MNRVAIDTSPLESGHKGRGVGTYTRQLVEALKPTRTDIEFIFTPEPEQVSADLVHYPYFDLFFHTLPLRKKCKTVVTIHDVIPLQYSEQFPVGIKGSFKLQIQKLSLRSVQQVITDSQASKEKIQQHLNVAAGKIQPIYLASNASFKPSTQTKKKRLHEKYQLPEKFLLFVGSLSYNKNIPNLIRAIGKVNQLPLVINTQTDIGSTETEKQTRMVLDDVNQALKSVSPNLVKVVRMDSIEDLSVLYSAAEWYIQPSLDEGFGLPVLESLQSGTPVLSAHAGSLPEVAGKAAIYFDPTEEISMFRHIEKALKMSDKEKKVLVKKGLKQAANFSWAKTAQETIQVYQKVLQS